jgi:hypothetical protein
MGRRKKSGGLPELKPDADGIYYRELGWKRGKEADKFRQHKFYLGSDLTEAQIRFLKLGQVWEATERRWDRHGRLTPRALWDDVALQIGQAVSRGEQVCRVDLPPRLSWSDFSNSEVVRGATFPASEADPAQVVAWLRQLQTDYPMIRLVLENEEAQAVGERMLHDQASALIERGRRMLKKNNHQTLHQALDGFGEYLRERYTDHDKKLSLTGQVAAKEIPLIKSHIADMPLGDLDLAAIERWVDYWVKRPMTKRRKPAAPKTCSNVIKRIRWFVRWLHRAKEWDWRKPDDYEVLPVTVKLSGTELARRALGDQVDTYSVEELTILWKHAKPKERLLMIVALNTGAGAAELASLQTNEIRLNQSHRKYGTPGNWIMRIRHKTGVYGEWKLWDQTTEAIRWCLTNRPETKRAELLVTDEGEPVAEQTSGGNRAQVIPNTWQRLTARVRKLEDKTFRRLSFNKLRKTAINAIRDIADGETAGVFACHGKPVPSDTQIDLYSNRDFRRVHAACDKWGEKLAAMFAAVPEPFVASKRKHQKPEAIIKKRQQVVELRGAGKTLAQIGEEMGLSIGAVRNHLNKASVPS